MNTDYNAVNFTAIEGEKQMNLFSKNKKHIALFVLIMFLLTMMPVSAFAEELNAEPAVSDAVPMAAGDGPSMMDLSI